MVNPERISIYRKQQTIQIPSPQSKALTRHHEMCFLSFRYFFFPQEVMLINSLLSCFPLERKKKCFPSDGIKGLKIMLQGRLKVIFRVLKCIRISTALHALLSDSGKCNISTSVRKSSILLVSKRMLGAL